MKAFIRAHKKGDGFIGRFIAWFTFGKYKHISMVFKYDDASIIGFQSNTKNGVHFFRLDKISGNDIKVLEIPATNEQIIKMMEEANRLKGAGYDGRGIWGFVRRAVIHNPNKWFCSELAAHLCEKAGIPLQRMAPYSITPVICAASMVLIERPDL